LWIGSLIGSEESDEAASPLSLELLSLELLSLELLSLELLSLLEPLSLLELLSLDEALLLAAPSSPSDPQADATIARAARMTSNRFNMKTFPL